MFAIVLATLYVLNSPYRLPPVAAEAQTSLPLTYDDFSDNSINRSKWHVAGDVRESNGTLKVRLFRDGEPTQGIVSTENIPGGMNLRGFKLNFTRTTEPKNIDGWEMRSHFELTNGIDFIRVTDLHKQTYSIETGGSYGNKQVTVTVPADQIPDGPFEIRERAGSIEVRQGNSVHLTLAGQRVRPQSFFRFEGDGNPQGQSITGAPANFDLSMGQITLY